MGIREKARERGNKYLGENDPWMRDNVMKKIILIIYLAAKRKLLTIWIVAHDNWFVFFFRRIKFY